MKVKTRKRYLILGGDYSQQECLLTAALCKDPSMYKFIIEGKDFYGQIASVSFHRPYEDCVEFYLDENGNKTDDVNEEGKKYRSQAKAIFLGILYGRQEASIAEQLGCSVEEAKKIKDDVFNGFPILKEFEENNIRQATTLGYVETLWGRKRRFPELLLPDYEFTWELGYEKSYPVPEKMKEEFTKKLYNCYWKNRGDLIDSFKKEYHVKTIFHNKQKADAKRQVTNARVQGSAADQTKSAIIAINENKRLEELDAHIIILIHDEILLECPYENALEVADIFSNCMINAGNDKFDLPVKVDIEFSDRWYGERISKEELK